MVLQTLLQPENEWVDVHGFSLTGALDASIILSMAVSLEPKIRVILDVGAQVLELNNEEVARRWLSSVADSEVQAAVYFDNNDEICVLSRDGRKELLQASPFADQMVRCLVYLDQAHTRGTDLKLPIDYRALVPLGPRLTKDRLVQACARMRKLGKGQSVVFCSSMGVQQKIRECTGWGNAPIEVLDVLRWSIAETCTHTQNSILLWATQGLRHKHQRAVTADGTMTLKTAQSLGEQEAKTLEQRYGTQTQNSLYETVQKMPSIGRETKVKAIMEKFETFGMRSLDSATLQEEQERELSPEHEREQEVELPPPATAYQHKLHPSVQRMITEGQIICDSSAFQSAFTIFHETTADKFLDASNWPTNLLVTTDFATSVRVQGKGMDCFLRPVHWIVSCQGQCLVMSPFEVQSLLPEIRESQKVTLHVYAPRVNKSMQTLESLAFCAIPPITQQWTLAPIIITQLNLFASQLYFRDYEEYQTVCNFLGLSHTPTDYIKTNHDGFIQPWDRALYGSAAVQQCKFTTSPLAYLAKVFELRRRGQSVAVTHAGKMLKGVLVLEEDF